MKDLIVHLPVGDDMPSARLLYGDDVKRSLRLLPTASVHCVATSPPYWGLRDYGISPLIWGGQAACEHVWETCLVTRKGSTNGRSDLGSTLEAAGSPKTLGPGQRNDHGDANNAYRDDTSRSCSTCGAWEGQLGQEPSPSLYVEHMVDVFREVSRVLRPDGTLWLNLGDSYANDGKWGGASGGKHVSEMHGATGIGRHRRASGLRPKNLVGIPWRVALALQEDGWILRNDVIWRKPNPMPSPVQDRFSCAHEYLFLLTKKPRYYFDLHAVKVPFTSGTYDDKGRYIPSQQWLSEDAENRKMNQTNGQLGTMAGPPRLFSRNKFDPASKNPGDFWDVAEDPTSSLPVEDKVVWLRERVRELEGMIIGAGYPDAVWEVPTQPFGGAHFACVDDETECLTLIGWKSRCDLSPGMLAAQYDIGSGTLSWAPIEGVVEYSVVDQEMVRVSCRDLDMLLTPNHRTLISRRQSRNGRGRKNLVVVEASDVRPSHAIPVSAPWAYDSGEEPFDGNWAELVGWYLAEGHAGRSTETAEIYQSRSANSEKTTRIEMLLKAVGADYSVVECDRIWHAKPDRMVAFQVRGFANIQLRQFVMNKQLNVSVLRWSLDLRTRLLKGLILGDGHRRQDDGRMSFIQKDKLTADVVHALGVSLGYAAHMTQRRGVWTVFFTNKRLIGLGGKARAASAVSRVRYTGIVWCPKLPHGTWVARRGGRMFITGNTWPQTIPERCILAGTSEYGCCASCGAPWERVVDRVDAQGNAVAGGGAKATASQEAGKIGRPDGGRRAAAESTFHNNPRKRTTPLVEQRGWSPTCACGAETRRCVILDPFSGSGTTGRVALRLGRDYVGIDLNEEYLPMTVARLLNDPPPEKPAPPPVGSTLDLFGEDDD